MQCNGAMRICPGCGQVHHDLKVSCSPDLLLRRKSHLRRAKLPRDCMPGYFPLPGDFGVKPVHRLLIVGTGPGCGFHNPYTISGPENAEKKGQDFAPVENVIYSIVPYVVVKTTKKIPPAILPPGQRGTHGPALARNAITGELLARTGILHGVGRKQDQWG